MEIMRCEQICLMPAACVKCEKIFDASHDFKKEEEIAEKALLKKNAALLCWECRQKK